MKFNPFAKAEELPDETLDEIAAEDEQRRLALLERERRIVAKAEAERAEEVARTERERRRQVAALLAEHVALADELVRVVAALGAGLVGAACALEKRDGLLGRARALQAELKALGAPSPSVSVVFAPEAVTAARKLARLVDYELGQNPLASAYGASPGAFR
jgi:hypothetical protein